MSLSQHFVLLFSTMVSEYEKTGSGYLNWGADTHFNDAIKNLKLLQGCFESAPDAFNEQTLIHYFCFSAVLFLKTDPTFIAKLHSFVQSYYKNRDNTNTDHLLSNEMIITIAPPSASEDIGMQLMKALEYQRNAHIAEIAAFNSKLTSLQKENSNLNQANVELKLENEQLTQLKARIAQLEKATHLIEELNRTVMPNKESATNLHQTTNTNVSKPKPGAQTTKELSQPPEEPRPQSQPATTHSSSLTLASNTNTSTPPKAPPPPPPLNHKTSDTPQPIQVRGNDSLFFTELSKEIAERQKRPKPTDTPCPDPQKKNPSPLASSTPKY